MDRLTPERRSYNMSQVRAKNTKPELFVFKILEKLGILFEKHYKIPGKPDVAFPEKRVAVFINGEFWHGRHFHKEKNRYSEFWVNKIKGNMIRDRKNYKLLESEGWKSVRLWDKDIKKYPKKEINKIMKAIERPLISKSDLQI